MRQKGAWSEARFVSRAATVAMRGSSTFEGEQRARQGKGLDSLVDPKERGVIREAKNLLVPVGGRFELKFGIAMPVKSDIDTTGSMGGNVDIAFKVQPKVQNLLVQGRNAVLKRYHTQIATGAIQDEVDQFPYEISQFEPDNEVERQMGLLVPEREGGDTPEEYQIGLFSTGYLTRSSISKYGLRGYYFAIGDVWGHDSIEERLLLRVFGPRVFEFAFGNKPQSMPSVREVAQKCLQDWHVFFLRVGTDQMAGQWWSRIIGEERIVQLPRTENLAEVQAVIIGLTEGTLDLQNAVDFLREARISNAEARRIVEACAGIPIGLQKTFANFEKIPQAGALFANRGDIWPIGTVTADAGEKFDMPASAKPDKPDAPEWKL